GVQEVRQRMLWRNVGRGVDPRLDLFHPRQVLPRHTPPNAEPRRKRLACGTTIAGYTFGTHRYQRRRPAVAEIEFAINIIFNHRRTGTLSPSHQLMPTTFGHAGPGWIGK